MRDWDPAWDSLPPDPPALDLRLYRLPQYKVEAVRLAKQEGAVVVSFLSGSSHSGRCYTVTPACCRPN